LVQSIQVWLSDQHHSIVSAELASATHRRELTAIGRALRDIQKKEGKQVVEERMVLSDALFARQL